LPLAGFSSEDGPGYGLRVATYVYDGHTVPYRNSTSVQAFFTTKGKWAHRLLVDYPQIRPGHRLEIELRYDKEDRANFFGNLDNGQIADFSHDEQTFRQQDPYLAVRWIQDLRRPWRLQLGLRTGKTFIDLHAASGSILQSLAPLGDAGGGLTQFNAALRHDTRDNYINTTRGHLSEVRVEHGLGADNTFNGGTIDLQHRHFISPHPSFVLAHRASTTYTYGDVPFFEQPKLGSSKTLRGLSADRFRGEARVLLNTEVRWLGLPLSQKHQVFGGLNLFGDLGQIYDRTASPSLTGWNVGVGIGARLYWYSTVVRADYGQSDGDSALYMRFAQIF